MYGERRVPAWSGLAMTSAPAPGTVDHAGWVVTLHYPEEQNFSGKMLEEALAWCLVWLMAPELRIGPFMV